ncbi:MAG: DUF4339 domain-containing protein [Planctomycetaceae bacterium]|nr:DUF4339 domain-containing protein [Planctomycetaceae bacterium]
MIQLVIAAICGTIAGAIASSKGRSVGGWFAGGFFLGLIGIVIVACLANLKEQAQQQEFAENERRRLREQLRQERIKTETFRRHAAARLDAHDQLAGVDTRQLGLPAPSAMPQLTDDPLGALLGQTDAPKPGAVVPSQQGRATPVVHRSTATPVPPEAEPAIWFYVRNGQSQGPLAAAHISALIRRGAIGPRTLLWAEGFPDWTAAQSVVGFAEEFSE